MNLTVMSEHRWTLAGLRGGELAVLQLAQQRKDQYIPSESPVMTVVEDKSPLANRSRASVLEFT
jgi:hypothetical protein